MKKRGIFWLVSPVALTFIGLIILGLNSLTDPGSGIHVVLNLFSFLFTGVGFIAFIPGLIYGIVILTKK